MASKKNFETQLQGWLAEQNEDGDWPGRAEYVIPSLKKLPAKLRSIGYSVFNLDQAGEEIDEYCYDDNRRTQYLASRKRAAKDRQLFDNLSAADRKKIFSVVNKEMAGVLESTWQHLKSAPYNVGYYQSPFRAPKNPKVTLESRVSWLCVFIDVIARFQKEIVTPVWLATWGKHAFEYTSKYLTPVLVASLNGKGKTGDEVFKILYQTVTREHPIGMMANFVIESLLGSNREEGWTLIENTLLAAKRQEGLRQSIVGSIDCAHPESFKRMLKIILDEALIRFSSVARSVDIWLRLLWDAASTKVLEENVRSILDLLDSSARKKALQSDDAELVYRALWTTAIEDAAATVKLANKLLRHQSEEIRYVAVWILSQLGIEPAAKGLHEAIADENLQVAVLAACGLDGLSGESSVLEVIGYCRADEEDIDVPKNAFTQLEGLYKRLPEKPTTLKPIVWPWTERKVKRGLVGQQLISALGDLPPTKLLPYMQGLNSWQQSQIVHMLSKQKKWDAATRSALIDLAGHKSIDVRETVYGALENKKLTAAECAQLESYLTRTAADLRVGVVELIFKQSDKIALSTAQRLLTSKNGQQRKAGLELTRQLAEADRERETCQLAAEEFRTQHKKLSKEDEIQLKGIAESHRASLTMDNALGLLDPAGRSPIPTPKKLKPKLITKAALECIRSLDNLVHKHRAVSIRYKRWGTWEESPLGSVDYGLPSLNLKKPLNNQLKELPLWETWKQWRDSRPAKLKDKDGLELLRALAAMNFMDSYDYEEINRFTKKPKNKALAKSILGEFSRVKLKYQDTVDEILRWLFYSKIPKGSFDYLLDCVENTAAHVPQAMLEEMVKPVSKKKKRHEWDCDDELDWRDDKIFEIWPDTIRSFIATTNIKLKASQVRREFELRRFWDEPIKGAKRERLLMSEWTLAFQKKYATKDDLVDTLLGPGRDTYDNYPELQSITSPTPGKSVREMLQKTKGLATLLDSIRETLLEVELERGEKSTVSTEAVLAVNSFYGVSTLYRILKSLDGKFKVLSGWNASTEDSRPATLTALVKATYPAEVDTQKSFNQIAKQLIDEGHSSLDQLLQLAFLAPQWSKFVGDYLNWDGFSEGLYWFLAHMDTWMSNATDAAASAEGIMDEDEEDDIDDEDYEAPEKLSAWERLILERTPLSLGERAEGAVDVDWFHRTFEQLGKTRWTKMAECAKLASNSAQAKKAQFLADVLLGVTPRKQLVEGIKKRNLKENVRLLGLLPLAKGSKRAKDILERYHVLLDYKKYARKLSSLTKPEALRAFEIGICNLARLAGFPDPLRLEWALEAESVKDLANGPVSITKEGVTITLELNEMGLPETRIQRGDKPLKQVPPKIKKKHKAVAELAERAKELRAKSSRIKQSLENAMCRGDVIEGAELAQLMQHAIVAPNIKRVVMIGEGIAGYPDKNGKALRDHRGELEPIKKKEKLRIAHPVDLLKQKDWHKWQAECFQVERIQPFKQVFREVYVLTKQEKTLDKSTRFAGQQIGPRQAMALWNSRGWNTQDEVIKIFHHHQIKAHVTFEDNIGTAAEIEGLTVDSVVFTKLDTYQPIKLNKVPPALLSEVMRDIDLVVSVAHRGEVDPETSESTIEMRTSLIRQTCTLLNLKNVAFKPRHVVIKGHYGDYSLHLGSGNVQRIPGGALAIVAVQSQHRGRVFLPFADNDPKTAEIVSKVLLLANDEEILDPMILDQLGAPLEARTKATPEQASSGKPKGNKKKSSRSSTSKLAKASRKSNTTSASKRRFEFSDDKSNKFWEIEIAGDTITTKWGRLGSKGQSKTKTYADDSKAQAAFEKLIDGKTSKGYSET